MSLSDELDDVCGPAPVPPVQEVAADFVHPLAAQLERCRPWLEEGMADSMFTWDQVRALVFQGRAQFWPGKNAALVTEIITYDKTKAIQVITAGGEMVELKKLATGAEAYGRMMQCDYAIVEGRKGWERALKDDGYEFYSVTVRKAL